MPWTAEQVLALAPDRAAATAASGQAVPARWPAAGASDGAVWGLCQGSRAKPYEVCVSLAGPAYRCSCPSRKIPCKHALGLLLMWSAGGVEAAPEPDWVRDWLAERAARAERATARRPGERDETAARKRQERRAERVASGVAELEGWLADQLRRGLGTLERGGSAEFAAAAARMVDAQAPGLAAGLRRAGDLAGRGRDWPSRVLEELAMLHLLVSAHARLDELPAGLAATVRTRLGYTVEVAEVVATGERVADRWLVLGVVDQVDERLVTRRVWLRGSDGGRPALVLSFAVPGAPLDNSFVTGTVVPGELAFYPGARPLRAVVATRSPAEPAGRPAGVSVRAALADYAGALAADPWLERWPVLLAAVTPATVDGGWALVDADGDALPLRAATDPWPLLAVSGGRPLTVAGDWSAAGLRPLSCWDGERPVRL
jgi:SWIM zinc finger